MNPKSETSKCQDYRAGKKSLHLSEKRGEMMNLCATFNPEYICCNVHVLHTVSNCPFDCTYCFLQNYLTDSTLTMVTDTDAVLHEVREKIAQAPERLFRIGNWVLGDSLALESVFAGSAELVCGFAGMKNALLELKTKSDCVDGLLDLDHRGQTVVSWSLNTEMVIRNEEHRTASLEKRLRAMEKVAQAGYLVGVHFDPMIVYPGWEKDYEKLPALVREAVPPERIAWISMGSLRFNPEMKDLIHRNFPRTKITHAEMVLGTDRKVRYVKPIRIALYSLLYGELRKHLGSQPFYYLCMERWDVWEKIFGQSPLSFEHLDELITNSVRSKYGVKSVP